MYKNKCNINIDIDRYLNTEKAYLIFRGTKTKEGMVSKSYNLVDSNASHVGFLLFENKSWNVHHIVENSLQTSALISNSLDEYIDSSLKVEYVALSELNLNNDCLRYQIHNLSQDIIEFDWEFSLENERNKLYCSEFIVKILNHCYRNIQIKSIKVKLSPLHSTFIGKDSLDYYPVDVLIVNENTK